MNKNDLKSKLQKLGQAAPPFKQLLGGHAIGVLCLKKTED